MRITERNVAYHGAFAREVDAETPFTNPISHRRLGGPTPELDSWGTGQLSVDDHA